MNLRFLRRASGRALLVGGMTLGLVGAAATVASAAGPLTNNWYVSSTGSDTANSCTNPASPCATIGHALYEQGLVSPVTGTIHVAASSTPYAEAVTIGNVNDGVTIAGAGATSTTIEPPASAISAEATAYNANNSNPLYADTDSATPQFYAVEVSPGTTGVTIKNVTVSGLNGIPALDSDGLGCGQDYLGIYFHESSGSLNKDDVNGIDMPTDLFGCQGGQGIYVNSSTSPAADNATVSMNKVSVATPLVTALTTAKLLAGTYNNDILAVNAVPRGWHSGEITVGGYELSATKDGHTAVFVTGTTPAVVKRNSTVIFYATTPAYNKNGITCDDVSTNCTITNATVQGGGPTNGIAQNGIQFFGNGNGSINGSTISDNNYTLGTPGNAASGILILDSGTVSVGNSAINTVESNDVNIYAGEIQAYAPGFADGIPTAQTWTIGGQGNDVLGATQDGESVGANGYGEGIQLDGTTNPVDLFGNNIAGSAQSAILFTGVENATVGGSGTGEPNDIGTGGENFSGLVLAGPSTECETVGGGAPTSGCSYGGYPGQPTGPPDSPGWASYDNTVTDNVIEGNLAGVVADGAFAPNYDGLSADPDGSYANTFTGNTWADNFLANVVDFSGQGSTYGNTIAPSAGNTGLNVANGYTGNSCNPYPGGSSNVNSIAGLNGANYGTTVNQGVVTASSTTVTAPNPSTNSTPPPDTPGFTNVYAGEGVLDITPSSGAVPTSPNGTHVTAVASPTSLTISNAATASTTGQTPSDTNDQLSFGQDWAC